VSTLHWCDLGRVDYDAARALQNRLAAERAAGIRGDLLLLLEHPPVVTIGRNADLAGPIPPRLPVIRTDRGGNVTYHGPGQLVAYPVIALRSRVRGVRDFVARLESALRDVAAHYGVATHVRCGAPGVWTGEGDAAQKLASIGLAVRRGVTLHGAALNVAREAERGFEGFDPCGLPGVQVTSLAGQGAPGLTPTDVAPVLAQAIATRFGLELRSCDVAALTHPDSLLPTAATSARTLDDHGHQPAS
jgi:lipoyl(octanoyl) transferase